ncbi:MAG: hypothetical protein WCF18_25685 [Chthoniobacteraceae bacterium]
MISSPQAAEAAAASDRYAAAYRSAFSIDGAAPEEVPSADGGEIRGVVVHEEPVNNRVGKHLETIAYEEIAISLGANQSPGIYAWIQSMLDGNPQPKNGSIVAVDARGRPRNQIQFTDGRITEVAFPTLDARSRVAAELAITIEPGGLTPREPASTLAPPNRAKQKPWLGSNFRLNIDGLASACARVTKIEAITIKQSFIYPDGPHSTPNASPLDVSDLVFYCPEEFAEPFRAWAREFIVQNSGGERSATLEFLAPDFKTVFFTLLLSGLGIRGCGLQGDDLKTASARVVKVELYCENVSLYVGPYNPTT